MIKSCNFTYVFEISITTINIKPKVLSFQWEKILQPLPMVISGHAIWWTRYINWNANLFLWIYLLLLLSLTRTMTLMMEFCLKLKGLWNDACYLKINLSGKCNLEIKSIRTKEIPKQTKKHTQKIDSKTEKTNPKLLLDTNNKLNTLK